MADETNKIPLLEFETFGGYKVRFQQTRDIKNFINREKSQYRPLFEFFDFIDSNIETSDILNSYLNAVQNKNNSILEVLINLEKKISNQEPGLHEALNPTHIAKGELKDLSVAEHYISSQSDRGKLIQDTLKSEGQAVALILYCTFIVPTQIFPSEISSISKKAFQIYSVMQEENKSNLLSWTIEDEESKKLLSFGDRIENTDTGLTILQDKYEKLRKDIANIQDKSDALDTKFDTLETDTNDKISDIETKATETIDNFTNAQKEAVKTSASRNYWETKHESHKEWIQIMVGMIAFTIIVTVSVFFGLAPKLSGNGSNPILDMSFKDIQIGQLGVTIFVVSTIVWILRFQSKVLVSHLHRAADATERVTMIDTYISLIADDALAKLSDQDMQLILQVIFRPTVDGFVKDDGPGLVVNIPKGFKAG